MSPEPSLAEILAYWRVKAIDEPITLAKHACCAQFVCQCSAMEVNQAAKEYEAVLQLTHGRPAARL
jgi:hypothetical protein